MTKFQTVQQRQEAGARVREEVLGTPHVKSGGTDPFKSHGHKKADAQRIRELIETAQGSVDLGDSSERIKLA